MEGLWEKWVGWCLQKNEKETKMKECFSEEVQKPSDQGYFQRLKFLGAGERKAKIFGFPVPRSGKSGYLWATSEAV